MTRREHPALAPEPVAAASVISLLDAIERHGPAAPAAIAFRSALRRKGVEADAAGGLQALDTLMDEIAAADLERADAQIALLRTAWTDLLPAPAERGSRSATPSPVKGGGEPPPPAGTIKRTRP